MPIKERMIRVSIDLPASASQNNKAGTVLLDESLMIEVRIAKYALAVQSQAIIDVGFLSQDIRQELLSQFSAYLNRIRQEGEDNNPYATVSISAGYRENGVEKIAPIFKGQVALCDITEMPPNMVFKITAYTNQIDRARFSEIPPQEMTFKEYCEWAAKQMGMQANVDTSINDTIIENPGRTVFTVAALIPDIQRYDRQNIAAWVDDGTLYVRDVNKVINPSDVVQILYLIGTTNWTAWGIDFTTPFNQDIKLAGAVRLNSKLNPSVNNSDLVVVRIEYFLASRSRQFYVRVGTAPSA